MALTQHRGPTPIRRKPTSGWRVTHYADMEQIDPLGLDAAFCMRCGQRLRHVFVVAHPDWHREMLVGEKCAAALEDHP